MVTLRGNALRFLISLRTYFISVELVKKPVGGINLVHT